MNRIAAGAMVAAMALAACSGVVGPTQQIIYVTEPPSVAPTPSPAPTPAPTPSASLSPCPEAPKLTSYFCATKNGEGGHGGPPLLDLPGQIAFDYRVSGVCVFTLGLASETPGVGFPSLTMAVSGRENTGTWRVSIKAGRYYPVISESVGCTYSVDVRDDR
jgi:hypothetical protein